MPHISLNRCVQRTRDWLGQDCQLCGEESATELICASCAADLPVLPPHCPQCALPGSGGVTCGECLKRPPHFDATLALWHYGFPCDRLVRSLKYHARLALAAFFARSLASRPLRPVDLVLPMPLHPRRLAERGFNQALEIAREIAQRARVPLGPCAAQRVKDTAQQTGLPYDRRAGNVRGAFACNEDLSGMTVAVVDDVMTTGATLNELARILKRSGAARVENWVIARALPP